MINESDVIDIKISGFDSDKMSMTLRGQAVVDIGDDEPMLSRINIDIPIGLFNEMIKESI